MRTLCHRRITSTLVLLLALAPVAAAAQPDESYELELHFIGRDGQPSDPKHVSAYVLDDAKSPKVTNVKVEDDATAKLNLASGSYTILSYENVPLGSSGDGMIVTMLAYPELALDSDTSIDLDAREAKPVEIEPPLAAAELYSLHAAWDIHTSSHGAGIDHNGQLFTGRLGPHVPLHDVRTVFSATWLPAGAPADSAYQFHWAKFVQDELVTGYRERTRFSDFACVNTKFARGGAAVPVVFGGMGMLAEPTAQSQSASLLPIALPSSRRMFFYNDPQLEWTLTVHQSDPESDFIESYEQQFSATAAQGCPDMQWNQGVFGPGAGQGIHGTFPLDRSKDTLSIWPNVIVDSEGRRRSGLPFKQQHIRLLRDGELLKEVDETNLQTSVPPELAHYRIEIEVERDSKAELSTQVSLAWELDSETAEDFTPLPVSYVHFRPELSQNTAAPQGATFELPIRIESPDKDETRSLETLSVDVSYDDGASWTEAAVSGEGSDWKAELEHPQQSGYVSLRAAGADADGNKVEETIIRAYRLE